MSPNDQHPPEFKTRFEERFRRLNLPNPPLSQVTAATVLQFLDALRAKDAK